MQSVHEKCVLIDICGTLYFSNTTFDFFDSFIRRKSYRAFRWFFKTFAGRAVNKIAVEFFKRDLIRYVAVRYLRGMKKTYLLEQARDFYKTFWEYLRNEDAMEELNHFRAKGYTIILASATLDFIAEVIAEHLEISCFFGTTLDYDGEDICLGTMRQDRLGHKSEALDAMGVTIPYFCVMTDNVTDKDLLRRADSAILIKYPHTVQRWTSLISKYHLNIIKSYIYNENL